MLGRKTKRLETEDGKEAMSGRNTGREEWIRWYYSVESRGQRAAFIPTVHIRRDRRPEASIRAVLGGKRLELDFPPEAVRFSGKKDGVRIGGCYFSLKGIVVRLQVWMNGKPVRVMGRLVFSGRRPCCRAKGFLDLGGERLFFPESRACVEKERGKRLPAWIFRYWCSWTGRKENGLSVRVADGWASGGRGPRCSVLLRLDGSAYRLDTGRGARILRFDGRQVLIARGGLRLHVKTASGSLWCRFWKGDRLVLEYIGTGSASFVAGKMQKRGART